MNDMTEYLKLAKAIEKAPSIPPCMNSDPDAWFPDKLDYGQYAYREAKKLCKQCPVIAECLEYAMTTEQDFGVWGGMTPNERMRLRGRGRGRPRLSEI